MKQLFREQEMSGNSSSLDYSKLHRKDCQRAANLMHADEEEKTGDGFLHDNADQVLQPCFARNFFGTSTFPSLYESSCHSSYGSDQRKLRSLMTLIGSMFDSTEKLFSANSNEVEDSI